jgi:ATPase subunit of ABC transporter with duplicated ATPase domains
VSASASLVARDVCVSFGPRVVLDRVSLTVGPQHRIGVVAPNGTGKTTLLRVLAGLTRPDRGSVTRMPAEAAVGYLPQERERVPAETVRAFLARRTGVAAANAALDSASHALAAGAPGADDDYSAALDRFLALGAADFDARAEAVVTRVGLPAGLLGAQMTALSGGQAARAALAAILLSRYDVFLLDEPTNDLDFDGLGMLEEFLRDLEGGVVVVSHDRAFLDRTIDSVLEIDEHTHRATLFAGGWRAYLDERERARRHERERYEEYVTKRDVLRRREQQQREWSSQGVGKVRRSGETDKFIRHFRTHSSEHVAAKARITQRALERLEAEAVEKPWEGWQLRMEVATAGRSGDVVARLRDVAVRRGDFVLGPLSLEVRYGERLAILGRNGSGKTTLLHVLLGRLAAEHGERWLGPSVVVGELDQGCARYAGTERLLDTFVRSTGSDISTARSTLAKFGLGAEHVDRTSDTLSPGERTRAVLAQFSLVGVNCLVLDEPTNHLDLPAIDQLESALGGFTGTVLLVTHDRALLDAVHLTRTLRVDRGRIVEDASAV